MYYYKDIYITSFTLITRYRMKFRFTKISSIEIQSRNKKIDFFPGILILREEVKQQQYSAFISGLFFVECFIFSTLQLLVFIKIQTTYYVLTIKFQIQNKFMHVTFIYWSLNLSIYICPYLYPSTFSIRLKAVKVQNYYNI